MSLTYLKDFNQHWLRDSARLKRNGGTFTIYGEASDDLHYEYSDRLDEWDNVKSNTSWNLAKEKFPLSQYHEPSIELIEEYLSLYFEKPVQLKHVVSGVNKSNGYPYQVFGFIFFEDDK